MADNATSISNEREIQPMQLSLEQLSSLKQQQEEELQELQRQLETLVGARNRFLNSRNVLDEISGSAPGSSLLVPLNSSLYVPGTIVNSQSVIVELGTGYYCEKTIPAAKELIDRKVLFLTRLQD